MNWDPVVAAVVGGLPPTVAALYAWRNAKGARKSSDVAGSQMSEIHLVVNSQRETMMAEITTLKAEIVTLRAEVVATKAEIVAAKAEIAAARAVIVALTQAQKAPG